MSFDIRDMKEVCFWERAIVTKRRIVDFGFEFKKKTKIWKNLSPEKENCCLNSLTWKQRSEELIVLCWEAKRIVEFHALKHFSFVLYFEAVWLNIGLFFLLKKNSQTYIYWRRYNVNKKSFVVLQFFEKTFEENWKNEIKIKNLF